MLFRQRLVLSHYLFFYFCRLFSCNSTYLYKWCDLLYFWQVLRNKIRKRQEVDAAPTKWYHIRSFKYIYDDTLTHLNISQIDGVSLTDFSLAYSQMWIVIRQKDTSGKCYQDLYRQWVMQAVCEGLFFSFLLSLVFSITLSIYEMAANDSIHDIPIYIVSFVLSVIGIFACLREAQRYAENQIKEVIISYLLLTGQQPVEG